MTKDEALDKALEALENCTTWHLTREQFDKNVTAITAIKQARSAPVQEPVAWMDASGDIYKHELWADWNPPHTPLYTTTPASPVQEPLTWYEGTPPFPQDQEWFIAETIYGDRVVLRSLDEGREHKGNYAFKTADQTYMKQEIVKRWMQFPDCEYLPPAQEFVCSTGLCHYKSQREWVGLDQSDIDKLKHMIDWTATWSYGKFACEIERILKEKNA